MHETEVPGTFTNAVTLPVYVTTPIATVVIKTKRQFPQNRTCFIIGHCWFVIAFVLISSTGTLFPKPDLDSTLDMGFVVPEFH